LKDAGLPKWAARFIAQIYEIITKPVVYCGGAIRG
jgi:hypothetical protein